MSRFGPATSVSYVNQARVVSHISVHEQPVRDASNQPHAEVSFPHASVRAYCHDQIDTQNLTPDTATEGRHPSKTAK